MDRNGRKQYSQLTVMLCCIATTVATVVVMTVVDGKTQAENASLKQALRDELAIRTIEPIVWTLGTFPGKEVARELCAKGKANELTPTRQGWAKIDCVDPEGRDFRIVGFWPDGKTPSARAVVPHGRVGALAEYQRDPNKPDFTNWYIYRNGEKE